jgi:NAD(P)-dependent dehydrogenase (short-subunit alcohol dehydrogenase family)
LAEKSRPRTVWGALSREREIDADILPELTEVDLEKLDMARGLASEFAPDNIRVNVVSPGSIDTRRDNPEWYQGRLPNAAGVPLGRQGSVDEISVTCLFLVSEDGGFISGQTIHVNGGAHYY